MLPEPIISYDFFPSVATAMRRPTIESYSAESEERDKETAPQTGRFRRVLWDECRHDR